jgi:hypothetical protein
MRGSLRLVLHFVEIPGRAGNAIPPDLRRDPLPGLRGEAHFAGAAVSLAKGNTKPNRGA